MSGGIVILLIVIGVVIGCCCIKKKKKRGSAGSGQTSSASEHVELGNVSAVARQPESPVAPATVMGHQVPMQPPLPAVTAEGMPARSTSLSSEELNKLKELKQLVDEGVLTEKEFAAQKAMVLEKL